MLALERQVPTQTDRMDLGVRSAQRRMKQNQQVVINWCSGQGGPDPRLQRSGVGGWGGVPPSTEGSQEHRLEAGGSHVWGSISTPWNSVLQGSEVGVPAAVTGAWQAIEGFGFNSDPEREAVS